MSSTPNSARTRRAAAIAAAAVAIGLMSAPLAVADEVAAPTSSTLGQAAQLTNGDVIQSWTVSGLRPSSDAIPHAVGGTLWEATATNTAVQGSVQPIVSNLNARSADGENYRVLFGAATPQGVNPAPLAQGEKTTGKVYFDVTGAAPDRVVYNAGGHDLLVWNPAPPPQAAPAPSSGGTYRVPSPAASAPAAVPAAAAPAPAPAATGSQGTPIAEGTPATTGSQGTPISESTPAAPAATGSQGTAPAPAATQGTAPAATGSQGTPLPATVPTTVVVAPAATPSS